MDPHPPGAQRPHLAEEHPISLTIRELSHEDRHLFQERICAKEKGVTYPLGADRFEIDHGSDYFAFFDRLGEAAYHVVLDEARVVAVGCIILRNVPRQAGRSPERTWYLCDLKVDPSYRRRGIPWKLFKYGFPTKYPRCGRFYGVTMNPSDGSDNPVLRILDRFRLVPINVANTLLLYSLSAEEMSEVTPTLEAERGPVSYLSLAGVKDIVLQSDGQAMPLRHAQFGPCAQTHSIPGYGHHYSAPEPGCVHMFCTPADDALARSMQERGLAPSATATIFHHRMKRWDWRFILTSEI